MQILIVIIIVLSNSNKEISYVSNFPFNSIIYSFRSYSTTFPKSPNQSSLHTLLYNSQPPKFQRPLLHSIHFSHSFHNTTIHSNLQKKPPNQWALLKQVRFCYQLKWWEFLYHFLAFSLSAPSNSSVFQNSLENLNQKRAKFLMRLGNMMKLLMKNALIQLSPKFEVLFLLH